MKFRYFLLLVVLSVVGQASVYTRQHADTIVEDRKILADDLNDEFNAIQTAVNSIDSSNITDGSLTYADFAATSSALTLNKKFGCKFYRPAAGSLNEAKIISIEPPCEIFTDGLRSFITATTSISLQNNLANGSLATANFYYIYATRNSSSLGFDFSITPPDLTTGRRTGDTTRYYIGSVRTGIATQDIVQFRRDGNHTIFDTDTDQHLGLIATPGIYSTNSFAVNIPLHFKHVLLRYAAYNDNTYPAQCEFQVSDMTPEVQAVMVATGGNTGVVPFWVPIQASGTLTALKINNISNCSKGGDVRIIGWGEPLSFFQ